MNLNNTFKLSCPSCDQRYEIEQSQIGGAVSCPKCNKIFEIKDPNAAPALIKSHIRNPAPDQPLVRTDSRAIVAAQGRPTEVVLPVTNDNHSNRKEAPQSNQGLYQYDQESIALLKKYMPLSSGEYITCYLKGDAYTTSSSVIIRFFMWIVKVISWLTGSIKRTHVFTTNRRVITVSQNKFLWFFDAAAESISYTPESISEAGYSLKRNLAIFTSHYFLYTSRSGSYLVRSRSGKERIHEMIEELTLLRVNGKGKAKSDSQ